MKALFIRLAGIGLLSFATSAGATNLLVGVDPETGEAKYYIASGVGSIERDAPAASGGDSTTVLPSQQLSLDPETEASLVAQSVAFMTQDIIEAMLRSQAQISAENEAFIAALDRSLGGEPAREPDPDHVAAVQANIDRLIEIVLQSAAEQAVLTPEQVKAFTDRARSQAQRPSLADSSPPPPELDSDQKAKRQAQLELLAKQRQQEQEQQKREELTQQNQELLKRIEEQKRRLEQQNREAKQQAADKAREAYEQKLTEAQKRRLAERVTLPGGGGHMNPRSPATPESQLDHLNTVAGVGGGGEGIAGAPAPEGDLVDVHTDYANQEQQSEAIEEAAKELAALDPELTPELPPEPINSWAGFLANNDGLHTEAYPSESIYGEAVGVYTGLVRGGFDEGPSANGLLSMNISFLTNSADGQIVFDGGQGTMRFDGFVGGTGFELSTEGSAFGGDASGYLYGRMYGPKGEEIGGTWGMHVRNGELSGQNATGSFAAKQ